MVKEIGYEQYKYFCSFLPCKDVFYFIKNLFVQFDNDETIYAVKYNFNSNPEKIYSDLISNNNIESWSMADFLKGLPVNDNGTYIQDGMYRDKSILIKM